MEGNQDQIETLLRFSSHFRAPGPPRKARADFTNSGMSECRRRVMYHLTRGQIALCV